VLIPAFNEGGNLSVVLEQLKGLSKQIKELGWTQHILVIDDGSEDGTAWVARDFEVNLLQHSVNLGYGAALQSGFTYALHEQFDGILSIDADGQHQPSDILRLLRVFNTGEYDVVLGSRFVEDTGYKTNWSRRFGIYMFSFVLKVLSGKKIADVTTGFQLVSPKVAALFAKEYPHDYPDAQVLLLLSMTGFRIKEVPIVVKQRTSGTSMHGPLKSFLYPVRNVLAIFVMLLKVSHHTKLFGHPN